MNLNKKRIGIVTAWLISLLIVATFVYVVFAQTASTFWITEGIYPSTATNTIWKEGSTIYSKSIYGVLAWGTNFTSIVENTIIEDGHTHVREGDYSGIDSSVQIGVSFTLSGEGWGTQLTLAGSTNINIIEITNNADYVEIYGLNLNGNNASQTDQADETIQNGIYAKGTSGDRVTNAKIHHNFVSFNERDGIFLNDYVDSFRVHDNEVFSNDEYGIQIETSVYGSVDHNRVYYNEFAGIFWHASIYATCTDNIVYENKFYGIEAISVLSANFNDNMVKGTGFAGVGGFGFYLETNHYCTFDGNVLVENDDHAFRVQGTTSSTFMGNTIYVKPADYTGGAFYITDSEPAITYYHESENLTISGNQIVNYQGNNPIQIFNGSWITISDNIIDNERDYDIQISALVLGNITNFAITGNVITGWGRAGIEIGASSGTPPVNSTFGTIGDNVVTWCGGFGSGHDAIEIHSGKYISIHDNLAVDNTDQGLSIDGTSDYNIVIGNIVSGSIGIVGANNLPATIGDFNIENA